MTGKLLATENAALEKFLSPDESWAWLIIMLSVLAVFYLVFCCFYKVNKLVRLIGWVYVGIMLVGNVGVVAISPDIYTVLCILFSIMLMMAILSIILPNAPVGSKPSGTEEEGETKTKSTKLGAYVVRELQDGNYCFELYDVQNKFLVRSYHCYADMRLTKANIAVCRDSGEVATLEDRTGLWIKETYHPKFELYKEGENYFFRLSVDGTYIILQSEAFEDLALCKKQLTKAMKAVGSTEVYISVEKLTAEETAVFAERMYVEPAVHTAAPAPVAQPVAQPAPVQQPAPAPEAQPVQPEPVAEVKEEPAPVAEEVEELPEAEDVEGEVAFSTNGAKTLWEKYAELDSVQRGYFDEIRKKANEKEEVKEVEATNYLTFKYGKEKLLRLLIKRGTVGTIFMLIDPTFKKHLAENEDVKVRETATPIYVENEAYLQMVKDTIDLKYDTLVEERKAKEEARKAERREKARQRRLAEKEDK